jgi:hypothetical protein
MGEQEVRGVREKGREDGKREKGRGKEIFRSDIMYSTQLPVHQRMNANGKWHQMVYFPVTNNTIKLDFCYGYNV